MHLLVGQDSGRDGMVTTVARWGQKAVEAFWKQLSVLICITFITFIFHNGITNSIIFSSYHSSPHLPQDNRELATVI